jgi:hypothetical protein
MYLPLSVTAALPLSLNFFFHSVYLAAFLLPLSYPLSPALLSYHVLDSASLTNGLDFASSTTKLDFASSTTGVDFTSESS